MTKKIDAMTLSQFNDQQQLLVNYNENLKDARMYNCLLESQFFTIIYANTNEENELKKRDKAYNVFFLLKLLLTNTDSFINKHGTLAQLLFNTVIQKKELEKEIETIAPLLKLDTYNKKQIIDTIQSSSDKAINLQKASSVLNFIKQMKAKPTELNQFINKYINTLKKYWNNSEIKNDKHYSLLHLDDDNGKEEYDIVYRILIILASNAAIIPFAVNKTMKDINYLYNHIYDDDVISIETIEHLIKVVEYVTELKKSIGNGKEEVTTDMVLMENWFSLIKQRSSDSMLEMYFRTVSESIDSLMELNNSQSESFYKIINKLYDCSVFKIHLVDGSQYACTTGDRSFKQIIEYRDKCLLITHNKEENEHVRDFKEICKIFAETIDNIELLFLNIINLDNKGNPESIDLTIEVKQGKATIDGKTLKDFNGIYDNNSNELGEYILKGYKDSEYINFIFGKQFRALYEYIIKAKGKKSKGNAGENLVKHNDIDNSIDIGNAFVEELIHYITNHKCKELIDYKYDPKSSNVFEDMIKTIDDYFIQLTKENSILLKDIYRNNLIIGLDSIPKGIQLVHCSTDEFERSVINWFIKLTQSLPLPQTILYCNDYTSSDKITAFLYRTIQCKEQVLFFIIGANTLDIEKRELIKSLLTEIYTDKEERMTSTLVFLYFDKGCELINHIKTLKVVNTLSNIDIADVNCKSLTEKIKVISSDISGIGKSMYIENQIKSSLDKPYVYFPIGGEFNQERIVHRLHELHLASYSASGLALHLDITDTHQVVLMKHFLFSLLITKCYYYNEGIVNLNNDINIFIEIPNCFFSFFDKFPILKLFYHTELKVNKLSL